MSEFFRKSLYRPSAPRLLWVKYVTQVSPGLLNLTLTGEGLEDFPSYCPAAHVKLFLARPGQDQPVLPRLGPKGPQWPKGEEKPIVRTYSVRHFRADQHEIDVEFAIHGVAGPATQFARNARPGDFVGLSYPGGPDPMIPDAQHYRFAGDMSSVPALASILEHLPKDVSGEVLIRVDDDADIRELTRPAKVDLRWFRAPPGEIGELVDVFCSLPIPDVKAFFWIGGEHALVVRLRSFLTKEAGITKDALYALPYWRHHFDEEGYHATRDEVMHDAEVSQ